MTSKILVELLELQHHCHSSEGFSKRGLDLNVENYKFYLRTRIDIIYIQYVCALRKCSLAVTLVYN